MKRYFVTLLLFVPLLFSCKGKEEGGEQLPQLETPTNVVVTVNEAGKTIVTWEDSNSLERGFSIWTKTSFYGLATQITTVGPNVTRCDITSFLKNGTSYYIGVAAEGIEGYTSTSETRYSTIYSFSYTEPELVPDDPDDDPGDDPVEDPTTPAVYFVGDPLCTNASIKVEYGFKNISTTDTFTCGVTWNETGEPLYDSEESTPAGSDRRGYETVVQAIHAVCLEQGKTYHMRAWVKYDGEVYYSKEIEVSLGAALDPIELTWTDITPSTFPTEVKVYKTTSTLNGDKFNAWYAIADLSTGKVEGRMNLTQGTRRTLEQQYQADTKKPLVLINGGYFYGNNAVGLAVMNSSVISSLYSVRGTLRSDSSYAISDEYDVMYEVTRGCFGFDSKGTPAIYWSYGSVYYSSPLPQIVGEAIYQAPNNYMPHSKVSWSPKYAVGAGPVLVKDGKAVVNAEQTARGDEYFLNNFELIPYDIFGATVTPDRTAVGITEDGKVIYFVCDGRIKASDGATITEMAQIMLGLGCVDALNLDGGGSTAMLVAGTRANSLESSTSGATENRAVATNLGFYLK